MADLMEERVRSIELWAGLTFTAGAVILALSLALYPNLAPANQTNLILDTLVKQNVDSWMGLHAAMALGFLLATVGFTAFAFLLHLRGSSGPASLVSVCALVGGALWVGFLSMEFFVTPFIRNAYTIDPGLTTMVFSAIWFWKMGALALGAVLLFVAVMGAGTAGAMRGIIPAWLGYAGALVGGMGVLVYVFDFWGSTVTGAAINPMRGTFVRFGIGLPLQVWMVAVGATLLREFRERAHVVPPQARTPVPRREPTVIQGGGGGGGGQRGGGGQHGGAAGGTGSGQHSGLGGPGGGIAAAGGMHGAPEPPPLPPPIP